MSVIVDNVGPIMSTAVIFADVTSIALYVAGTRWGLQHERVTGNPIYDVFMGVIRNPRPWGGRPDVKLFFEIRISWLLLSLFTFSACVKQYEQHGYVSGPLALITLAQFLYTNACMKGEECVPTTWDIFHEPFGWMLCFWNSCGVSVVYGANAMYALRNTGELETERHPEFLAALALVLCSAYYVWDTSQSQRNRFRTALTGTFHARNTFPQFAYGTLKNPTYLDTAHGTLLIDGWWAHCRKPHYAADIVMAWCWALPCGAHGLLPYLYPLFFTAMITHRALRDDARCAAKYRDDWVTYKKFVPNLFLPRLDGVVVPPGFDRARVQSGNGAVDA